MREDTLWTLSDVARYLKMNERTVAKLAANGTLPGAKVANLWRFKPSLVEEWLVQQIKTLSHEQMAEHALDSRPAPIEVAPLFDPRACLMDQNGARREDALRQLAKAMADAGMIEDFHGFVAAVLHREHLCSTGIGDGIAVPHARHSSEKFCRQPGIGFGRSTKGIPFDALDERPVHLLFLIGAPDDGTHLRIMAQIARLFRESTLREDLLAASSPDQVLRTIAQHERQALAVSC